MRYSTIRQHAAMHSHYREIYEQYTMLYCRDMYCIASEILTVYRNKFCRHRLITDENEFLQIVNIFLLLISNRTFCGFTYRTPCLVLRYNLGILAKEIRKVQLEIATTT